MRRCDGDTQTFRDLAVDQTFEITEGQEGYEQ